MTNDSKMIFGFYHKSELIRYLSTCDDENLIFAAIDCSGEAEASLRRIQEIEENTNLPACCQPSDFLRACRALLIS